MTDLDLSLDDISAQRSDCTIAAMYVRDPVRPAIVVAPTLSRGRLLFSLLHEYCHYLIDRDPQVADFLFMLEPDLGAEMEELVCDAFASAILVPDTTVRSAIGASSVDAYSFERVYAATAASREASAVALSEQMTSPGYVVLGVVDQPEDTAPRIQFAAPTMGAFGIRRGTRQPGTLLDTARHTGSASGLDSLWHASGAKTEEMHGHVIARENYLFAVYMVDRPAWGNFRTRGTPVRGGYGYGPAWCDRCDSEFVPTSPPCTICGSSTCPSCGRCECESVSPRGARVCMGCFQERPAHLFDNGDVCRLCRE